MEFYFIWDFCCLGYNLAQIFDESSKFIFLKIDYGFCGYALHLYLKWYIV